MPEPSFAHSIGAIGPTPGNDQETHEYMVKFLADLSRGDHLEDGANRPHLAPCAFGGRHRACRPAAGRSHNRRTATTRCRRTGRASTRTGVAVLQIRGQRFTIRVNGSAGGLSTRTVLHRPRVRLKLSDVAAFSQNEKQPAPSCHMAGRRARLSSRSVGLIPEVLRR